MNKMKKLSSSLMQKSFIGCLIYVKLPKLVTMEEIMACTLYLSQK